jgi:hypothetical protein
VKMGAESSEATPKHNSPNAAALGLSSTTAAKHPINAVAMLPIPNQSKVKNENLIDTFPL